MGKRPREADGLEGFEPDDLLDWLTEPADGEINTFNLPLYYSDVHL